jgi:DnaJ-class molecular chaperone
MKRHKRSMRSGNKKKPINNKKVCTKCHGDGCNEYGWPCESCKGAGYVFGYNMGVKGK